jgi:diguanylate cyclase (GGDEF)-like protein
MTVPQRSDGGSPDDPVPGGREELRAALSLMEQGMGAVQDLLAVLREADHRILTLEARVRCLEQLVCFDDLTGLPNRRGLDAQLAQEEARAQRYGVPAAVAMIDVSGLQTVNDRHGRAGGDALLRALGKALRAGARGSDVVARYAGDEFVALLPGADLEGARVFVERVRTGVPFARLPSGEVVPILLTAGVATREEAGSLAGALDLAAHRLAEARKAERARQA